MTQTYLAAIAVVIGLVTAALLFVPYVALTYRRYGRLPVGRTLLWVGAVVYSWAIWAYTLLPLPDPDSGYTCAGYNLDPGVLITDVTEAYAEVGLTSALLRHPLILQIALNVVLFLPLGFFLRVLGGRGVIVATFAGLVLSGFIETTQITGLWGLYPCAYRVFDVEDLITNTAGATIGSLLALLVPASLRSSEPVAVGAARPVTRMRRLLAMVTDLAAFFIINIIASISTQAVLLYIMDRRDIATGTDISSTVGLVSATVVTILVGLSTGRTVGDHAVQLSYFHRTRAPLGRRVMRVLAGTGGYGLLLLTPFPGLATTLAFVSLVLTFTTENGRGLPGVMTGGSLRDVRS